MGPPLIKSREDAKRKQKLARSETVTVRLDPRLNYLCELAGRAQRRTKSSFVEWALQQAIKSMPDLGICTACGQSTAQGIEAAAADKTAQTGLAEGESPVPAGDAPNSLADIPAGYRSATVNNLQSLAASNNPTESKTPSDAVERALEAAAKATEECAVVIGAAPESSIHSALSYAARTIRAIDPRTITDASAPASTGEGA